MRDDPNKMDANRLIAEIYKRPALWNQRHMSYHNRDVTNRVWTEIASQLKLPKPLVKTKWKGLRDTFRAEMKKQQAYRKTKFARNRPVWIHFKNLQFLKDQMLPRPPVWERACLAANNNDDAASRDISSAGGNKPIARTVLRRRLNHNNSSRIVAAADTTRNNRRAGGRISGRTSSIHENRETICDNVMTSLMTFDGDGSDDIPGDEVDPISDDRHKRLQAVVPVSPVKLEPQDNCEVEDISDENHLVNYENDKSISSLAIMAEGEKTTPLVTNDLEGENPLGGATNNRYDDNYYFLVSLLPHIRSLPAERRMLLRMQMQQLVYQEVYKKTPPAAAAVAVGNQRIIAITEPARGSSCSPLRDKHYS